MLLCLFQRLRGEVATLERQLAAQKKQLEEETLLRVDLENRIQTLKEELAFQTQVHEQVIGYFTMIRLSILLKKILKCDFCFC